jgi:4-hydroxybenzoate polyprenyltransferase
MSTTLRGASIELRSPVSMFVTDPRKPSALPFDLDIPLLVDLDGTLLATDVLYEGLISIAISAPGTIPRVLSSLLKGRAALKSVVFENAQLDVTQLPFRADVIDLIKTERSAGRQVHLVTAANQLQAAAVSKVLPLFDGISGSTTEINLKGTKKLELIRTRFGNRFIYAGDAPADEPVFKAAAGAILVGPAAARHGRLTAAGVCVAGIIPNLASKRDDWFRLLRVRQWSKNILIGVPLLLSQQITGHTIAATVTAFLLFSLLASGTYVINDIHDLAVDRQHPTKKHRPLAAGLIRLGDALFVAVMLILTSVAAAAMLLPAAFTAVLVSYLVLTLAYSIGLKRVPLADANVIGILFTLRIVAGMVVLNQPISLWLTSFAATLFASFALAKRQTEFSRIAANASLRPTGRGYRVEDLPVTLAFGVSYAVASMLIMLLYFHFEAESKGLYQTVQWLYLVPAVLMLWVGRVWLLAQRGVLEDDPVEFALKDPVSWLYGVVLFAIWGLAAFY